MRKAYLDHVINQNAQHEKLTLPTPSNKFESFTRKSYHKHLHTCFRSTTGTAVSSSGCGGSIAEAEDEICLYSSSCESVQTLTSADEHVNSPSYLTKQKGCTWLSVYFDISKGTNFNDNIKLILAEFEAIFLFRIHICGDKFDVTTKTNTYCVDSINMPALMISYIYFFPVRRPPSFFTDSEFRRGRSSGRAARADESSDNAADTSGDNEQAGTETG